MEAMRGLFAAGDRSAAGASTLFIHANDAKQIAEVIRFKRAEDLERVVLVGGLDSWMMADPLRENDIAVMVMRTHSVPRFAEDDIDLPYKLPKLLEDEGVEYCLQGEGRMPEMNTRNLALLCGDRGRLWPRIRASCARLDIVYGHRSWASMELAARWSGARMRRSLFQRVMPST